MRFFTGSQNSEFCILFSTMVKNTWREKKTPLKQTKAVNARLKKHSGSALNLMLVEITLDYTGLNSYSLTELVC